MGGHFLDGFQKVFLVDVGIAMVGDVGGFNMADIFFDDLEETVVVV